MPAGRRGLPPHGSEQPVKKQSKWTPDEDALIIELRGSGMKWEDISKRLPGRSAISCRLHYQNYLERRSEWDEERKNKLARLYERFKAEMWSKVAEELAVPWRAAEAMHWLLGETDMARRAGVVPFSLAAVNVDVARHSPQRTQHMAPPQGSHVRGMTPVPHHGMHTRAHSLSNVPMNMSNPPRREMYGPPASHPALAPALAPAHAPSPARAPTPGPLPTISQQQQQQQLHHQQHQQQQNTVPLPPQQASSPLAQIKPEYSHGPVKAEYSDSPFTPGPGLPPIQTQPRQRAGDFLPGIAELTTGVGPYRDVHGQGVGPPPQMAPVPTGPSPGGPTPPFPGHSMNEPIRQKRRASTDAAAHEANRRRMM